MRITLVTKVLADGTACAKCKDVMRLLERGNHLSRIDRTLVADERDPAGSGWIAAQLYGVDSAPFFVVRTDDGRERVYTVFHEFLHEVLEAS